MSTVEAVERFLKDLPADLAGSPLAASALVMAAGLDEPGNSFTSKTMGASALQAVVRELRELSPPEQRKDGVDELRAKRARRRSAAAEG